MIEHDNINVQHLATVGFISAFPGLRKFLLITCICLFGMGAILTSVTGIMIAQAPAFRQAIREWCKHDLWIDVENLRRRNEKDVHWYTMPNGLVYVISDSGFGVCIPHKEGPFIQNRAYMYHLWETPFPAGVQLPMIPNDLILQKAGLILGIILGGAGIVFFFGLWVPATLLAMFSRRVLHNARDEFNEEW